MDVGAVPLRIANSSLNQQKGTRLPRLRKHFHSLLGSGEGCIAIQSPVAETNSYSDSSFELGWLRTLAKFQNILRKAGCKNQDVGQSEPLLFLEGRFVRCLSLPHPFSPPPAGNRYRFFWFIGNRETYSGTGGWQGDVLVRLGAAMSGDLQARRRWRSVWHMG
jgi:hypothetical protein